MLRRIGSLTALLAIGGISVYGHPARALLVVDFTAAFALSNWTKNPPSSIVDTSGGPYSLLITSPDDGSGDPGDSGFQITLPTDSYALSFSWSYSTTDLSPDFDPFGYTVNGQPNFFPLSDPLGGTTQSGFIKIVLNPNDHFAFLSSTTDNLGGSATTVISNFKAGLPNEVPDCCEVPAPLPVLAVGAAFSSVRKMRLLSSKLKSFSMG